MRLIVGTMITGVAIFGIAACGSDPANSPDGEAEVIKVDMDGVMRNCVTYRNRIDCDFTHEAR